MDFFLDMSKDYELDYDQVGKLEMRHMISQFSHVVLVVGKLRKALLCNRTCWEESEV